MGPGQYTELFFLDEATALSAGHRPCAECQRSRFNEFLTAWVAGQLKLFPDQRIPDRPRVAYIDGILHDERLDEKRGKRTVLVRAGDLPAGAFVMFTRQTNAIFGTVGFALSLGPFWLWHSNQERPLSASQSVDTSLNGRDSVSGLPTCDSPI